MPLSAGSRIGAYKILTPIGAGGMGEVYRAQDLKLKREIALKVLPAAVANDPGRLARFQREAEVLASLNHPNIAAIYGVEDRALAMELVEGESPKGPLAFDDAWTIALQIAGALEYAHDKGVVHRDLKPANVMVTHDGVVKLLDFGLAKAFTDQGDSTAGDPENSPTMTLGATVAGTILGTAAYMAPEQAKGKRVDKRADIWAWGVVLYELLAGERLFQGEDIADTLAQVLTKEPALDRVPPKVRNLLRRCLEKDPKQRLRDIGEARFLLSDGLAPSSPRAASSRFAWAGWAVAGVIAAAAAGYLLWPRPAELKPLVRLDLELEPPAATVQGAGPILSPDGARMVYVAKGRLYTRRLDQAETMELEGTEGASSPFFSPDGQWVGFYAQAHLKKVSVHGGGAVLIPGGAGMNGVGGGAWGEDGNIISHVGIGVAPLVRIPAAGGKAEPLGDLYREEREGIERWPQILPGGKFVLYTGVRPNPGVDPFTVLLSLPGLGREVVQRSAVFAEYAGLPDGSGYLLYVNGGTLSATPFDLKRQQTSGSATPLLQDVLQYPNYGAQFDISASGTLVYQHGKSGGNTFILQWLDNAGKLQPLLDKPGPYGRPSASPDGKRLALDNGSDVWTYDWQRDVMTRLTFSGGNGSMWSPDSRFVLYSGNGGIGWTRSDGGSAPQTLLQSSNLLYPWSFSPDGKRLAYLEITGEGYDLYTVSIENDGTALKAGKPEPFLKTPADERYPEFSPDGRWMMYISDESGVFQVYVRAFPDTGAKWQVSSSGGMYPEWSSDRRTIVFRTLDSQVMAVNYTAKGDAFTAEKPHLFADQRIAEVSQARNYALHPDGKRIAALMPVVSAGESKDATHVTILFNFFDELKRRIPAGK